MLRMKQNHGIIIQMEWVDQIIKDLLIYEPWCANVIENHVQKLKNVKSKKYNTNSKCQRDKKNTTLNFKIEYYN